MGIACATLSKIVPSYSKAFASTMVRFYSISHSRGQGQLCSASIDSSSNYAELIYLTYVFSQL